MTTFTFSRELKQDTINGIDLRNLKRVSSQYEEELKKWKHQLAFGDKPLDFTVTIEEFKRTKSYEQLRGYYRLVNMILPVIKRENPDHYFDKEVIDNMIKNEYGYYTEYNGVKTYKSKAKATIEDMIGLIKTAESIGAMLNIEDCFLSSEEERALKEFYKNN